MFIPCGERRGGAYYEFQYARRACPVEEAVQEGYTFWAADSLLVHDEDSEAFFDGYLRYLTPTNTPDGSTEFYPYGVNFYTQAQTQKILDRIKREQPTEYAVLADWLEKAAREHGFYLLGL